MVSMSASPDRDPVLASLVSVINTLAGEGNAVAVTLTVPGGMVSGLLVPAWEWFEEQQHAREAETGGDSFAVFFSMPAEQFKEARERHRAEVEQWTADGRPDEPADGDADADDEAPRFIHLRDARTPLPGGGWSPPTHWRGRLSEVTGWSWGATRPGEG